MVDFPTDPSVKYIIERYMQQGKPVASVCHGVACLLSAKNRQGEPVISGKQFTCFTNIEEAQVGMAEYMPFLLESALIEQGGYSKSAAPFEPRVVVDDVLVTGQNPASSRAVAQAVLEML